MSTPTLPRRERGFSTVELVVVLSIIGILAAYFGPRLLGSTDDARIVSAETVLTQKIPQAIMGYYASHRGSPKIDRPDLVKRGVAHDPIWNQGTWYIWPTDDPHTLSIGYPVGDDLDSSLKIARTIAGQLSASGESPFSNTRVRWGVRESGSTTDIKNAYPMIAEVKVKELINDQTSNYGISVLYNLP